MRSDFIVLSFGYLHQPAPTADLVIDLREYLYDPHGDPALRELTGHDDRIRDQVLHTRGARVLITTLCNLAEALGRARRHSDRTVTIALGCAGGRHRSVVIVNQLADRLARACWVTESYHRDIHQPIVNRPGVEDPR